MVEREKRGRRKEDPLPDSFRQKERYREGEFEKGLDLSRRRSKIGIEWQI